MNAPQGNGTNGHKKNQKRHEVSETQAEPEHGQQGAGIAGMTDKAIGTGVNQAVVFGDGDVGGKEASQINDRVPAQTQTEEQQGVNAFTCRNLPPCGPPRM